MRLRIFLAFGSNIGDRIEQLRKAEMMIRLNGMQKDSFSSLYESRPVDVEEQPLFVNAVGCYETRLDPFSLLRTLQRIETEMGREREGRVKGPRCIDIDLLFYGSCVIQTDQLKVPHPAFHLREFVLRPLAELDPAFVPPTMNGRSVEELLALCPDQVSNPVMLDVPPFK